MSIVSFRNNSRASSARSLRSNRSSNRSFNEDYDAFSSCSSRSRRSSSSSFDSELGSIRTDNRSLFSIRTQDFREPKDESKTPSNNGSNIFLKKPPIVPPRKKPVVEVEQLEEQERHKHQITNLNDDNSSLFSESTTDLNTPKVQNPIILLDKVFKCQENVSRLLTEYNVSACRFSKFHLKYTFRFYKIKLQVNEKR